MKLSNFDNKNGESIISFQPWQTSGTEYELDSSRWYCHLLVNGERIYEYGCPCGTCGIIFRKVGSTNHKISDPEAVQILGDLKKIPSSKGLQQLARVLEPGIYHPLVIEGKITSIEPGAANDYFATDVVRLFGFEPPEYKEPSGPWTTYYKFRSDNETGRTGHISGLHNALITAVVMPLHDPSKLNRERIDYWKQKHSQGNTLTAFAISVIDNQSPAMGSPDPTYKYEEHYLFTNCVIDGHHRIQAAAELEASVRILSFVSSQYSLIRENDDLKIVLSNFIN
ncbi:MAG: hypothetical protein JEZ00_20590 [Anaerolineaceae bacterium]|nr:hypothetical protein [Anaerolineaceae bacterium]